MPATSCHQNIAPQSGPSLKGSTCTSFVMPDRAPNVGYKYRVTSLAFDLNRAVQPLAQVVSTASICKCCYCQLHKISRGFVSSSYSGAFLQSPVLPQTLHCNDILRGPSSDQIDCPECTRAREACLARLLPFCMMIVASHRKMSKALV
jgi:hypothetical protein